MQILKKTKTKIQLIAASKTRKTWFVNPSDPQVNAFVIIDIRIIYIIKKEID